MVDIPLMAGSAFETVTTAGKKPSGEVNHVGVLPYTCCLDNRRQLYVSLWGAPRLRLST